MRVEVLTGSALDAALDDVARLRMTVFRAWPYVYDGDIGYEREYLQTYRESAKAILVGAFDGNQLVGASTGAPLEDHAGNFASAFGGSGYRLDNVFYCAESVLLPGYRGQGVGHRFFDLREAHARMLGLTHAAFCSVVRPDDHPLRPRGHVPLDAFWTKRGYARLNGAVARFAWKDIDQPNTSEHELQFWIRAL